MKHLAGVLLLVLGCCARHPLGPAAETVLNLGAVHAGTVHRVSTTVTNPTERDIYLFGVQKSCGCLSASLDAGLLAPGARRELVAEIVVPSGKARIDERIVIQADEPQLDGRSFHIRAHVKDAVAVMTPFGPRSFTSEKGGEGDVQIAIPWDSQFEAERLNQLVEGIFSTTITPGGTLLPFEILTSESFVELTSDQKSAIVTIRLRISPNSFRGRFAYYYVEYPLPASFGGGRIKAVVDCSLIPVLTVGDRPVLRWAKDSSTDEYSVLAIARTEDPDATVSFIELAGLASEGIVWRVSPIGVEPVTRWEVRASVQRKHLDQINATTMLAIPFVADETSYSLRLWLTK